MDFKQRFPNEIVLQRQLGEGWESFTDDVRNDIGELEQEYIKIKRLHLYGGIMFGTAFVVFGFFELLSAVLGGLGTFGSMILIALVVSSLVSLVYGVILLIRGGGVIERFNQQVNHLLFPKVFAVLGLEAEQFNGQDSKDQLLSLLDHSELITESRNAVLVDDMVSSTVDGQTMFAVELDVKHVTGSGKNRRVKNIFHGYFVSVDLDRTLNGETFISSEGDKKGFGHKSFWKSLRGKGALETELEWNEFENMLHVAATDGSEARYILSTDFMHDLYEWWKLKKRNIRISFIDNRMYVLFPDQNVKLGTTVPKIDTYELQKYAMTIATPLMHVLHLVEDVKKRF